MKKEIRGFLRDIEERNVNLHSFLLMEKGEIQGEWYQRPYNSQVLHRMYSVTKSLVSIAIGMLEEEGKLGLSDRICRYFRRESWGFLTESAGIFRNICLRPRFIPGFGIPGLRICLL